MSNGDLGGKRVASPVDNANSKHVDTATLGSPHLLSYAKSQEVYARAGPPLCTFLYEPFANAPYFS